MASISNGETGASVRAKLIAAGVASFANGDSGASIRAKIVAAGAASFAAGDIMGTIRTAKINAWLAAPVPVAFPALSNIKARWDPAAITGLADAANIAAIPDTKGGPSANSVIGTAPKYVASCAQAGGRPAVRFIGTGGMEVASFAGSAAETATSSGTYTIMAVVVNTSASAPGQAAPFASYNGTGSCRPILSGTQLGTANYNDLLPFTPGAAMTTYFIRHDATTNFSAYSINGTTPPLANGYGAFSGKFALGAYPGGFGDGFLYADGVLWIIWDKCLNEYETIQADRAARDLCGLAWPDAGKPFIVFSGNSLIAGYTLDAANKSVPFRTATALNRPFGTWTSIAETGADVGRMTTLQASSGMDALPTLLKTKPIQVSLDWFNTAKVTSTAQDTINAHVSFLQGRDAAGFANLFVTSATFGAGGLGQTQTQAQRSTFNSWFDVAGNRTTAKITYYAPLHLNANIGTAAAAPPSGGNTYFASDLVHFTGSADTTPSGTREASTVLSTPLTSVFA